MYYTLCGNCAAEPTEFDRASWIPETGIPARFCFIPTWEKPMGNPINRTERYTLRLRSDERELIEAAAAAQLRRPGDFIRTVAVPAARRVLASAAEQIETQGQ